MLGVVLWSDPVECKAVFWCEDQGDLAFYQADAKSRACDFFLEAGDMVTFETETTGKLRQAHDVTVVQEDAYRELPGKLRDTFTPPVEKQAGDRKILTFVVPSQRQDFSLRLRRRKV